MPAADAAAVSAAGSTALAAPRIIGSGVVQCGATETIRARRCFFAVAERSPAFPGDVSGTSWAVNIPFSGAVGGAAVGGSSGETGAVAWGSSGAAEASATA